LPEDCACFKEFLDNERRALRKALIKHQEELARKLKKKIAQREAELDFIENKIWSFCKEFRNDYCKKCPHRKKCHLNQLRLKKMRTPKRVTTLGKVVRSTLRCRRAERKAKGNAKEG